MDDLISFKDTPVEMKSAKGNKYQKSRPPPRNTVDQSILDHKRSLCVYNLKNEIKRAISENQILIVVGDTGTGKSTQIPQYLNEFGFAERGLIGCTQPRRVATISVAKRVAAELGCQLGEEVGYAVRFEECTSEKTCIRYMTDGIILRECLSDSRLNKYSVIMVDEAHERTVNTDVLLGLLKHVVKMRLKFNLIISSATLNARKFSEFFNNAPIFEIPGNSFPVQIVYKGDLETSYLHKSIKYIMDIHENYPPGDVLLFLSGQDEIEKVCDMFEIQMNNMRSKRPEIIMLPIYSALPLDKQTRIFEKAPPGFRKVVVATNIAETSITVDGIVYVIDCGKHKEKRYNFVTGIDSLELCDISQASAIQRAGRAGRTCPGTCFRFYSNGTFEKMLVSPVPEIQRIDITTIVLLLKAMGIHDVLKNFQFMDEPSIDSLTIALQQLKLYAAIDDEDILTNLGEKMVKFPLEADLSKILMKSVELNCSDEMLTIVSMLSVRHLFINNKKNKSISEKTLKQFNKDEGDLLTLLNIYNIWKENKNSVAWCKMNFIQHNVIREAEDIRKQLLNIMKRNKSNVVSSENTESIQRAICSGFFRNAAKRDDTEKAYRRFVDNKIIYVHPSSVIFHENPEWVVCHEITKTSKEYMRGVTAINPKWLVEAVPNFFKSFSDEKLTKFNLNFLL